MALAPTEAKSLTAADRPPTMLETVMQAVQNPNIDPARLREFLAIGRELELEKKKNEWSTAFAAAKRELDGVSINKRGVIVYEAKAGKAESRIPFMRYDDIAEAVKRVLRDHGLIVSYTYRTEPTPPKTICVMTILHDNGHSQTFESVPMPMIDQGGGKSDIQGAGSVMTYGRRYVICAAFDIVAEGEDNDGSGKTKNDPITDQELTTIQNIVQACEDKEPGFRVRFTKWMVKELKVDRVQDIRQGPQLTSVRTKLDEKLAALGLK